MSHNTCSVCGKLVRGPADFAHHLQSEHNERRPPSTNHHRCFLSEGVHVEKQRFCDEAEYSAWLKDLQRGGFDFSKWCDVFLFISC